MIVGFHYHVPAVMRNDKIYTAGFLGRFLDGLAGSVKELVCFMHSPLPSEEFMMDYALGRTNIRLVSLGPHYSVPRRLLQAGSIARRIADESRRLDVILIRCPTPLLPSISGIKGISKAFLLVGDYRKSAQDLRQPWLKKKAIQLWVSINGYQQDHAIRHSRVFVNNGVMFDELKNEIKKLSLVKTSTLERSDFFQREDTCSGKTINLLYTGRLDLSKGLLEMIQSLVAVRARHINAHLHVVGWEDRNATDITSYLLDQARGLQVNEYITFHGMKRIGEELNAFYRMADIYLIGSKMSEGFPRTIWEAFANGLPVIASGLNSIRYFLKDRIDALLVEPGDVEQMTAAIIELSTNRELRMSLLANGYVKALESITENVTKEMVETLKLDLIVPVT